ncbi:MAG: hypothetical protein ACREV7_11620 [Steroidobacteraceae bacterium]
MSRSVRRQRLLAIIAACAMVTCICGFSAHGFANPGAHSDADWAMHFTGVAGSAPQPAPVAKPVLAGWLAPPSTRTAPRTGRRLRAYSARAPPA